MYRKCTAIKSVPGCRYIVRGQVLPAFFTMGCIKGLIEPVAKQRGLDGVTRELLEEFVKIELLPGRPVSV